MQEEGEERPDRSTSERIAIALQRASRDAYLIAACIFVVGALFGMFSFFPSIYGRDAHAYWSVDFSHLYWARTYGARDAFYYSPAFAQFVWPATVLPWPLFSGALTVINVSALWWLAGRWSVLVMLLPPVFTEILAGNVNLLVAMALALGFRYPAAWAFCMLTKVTPGVGLLWFVVRREWRSLAIALGTTAVIVAASAVVAPGLWVDWFGLLTGNGSVLGDAADGQAFPVPFVFRAPLAVILVVLGALTNRPWLVPIAAFLSIPVIWPAHWTILLGSVAIVRRGDSILPTGALPRAA